MSTPIIFWFRQDLRLKDHPGWTAAVKTGKPLIALYILDESAAGHWQPGGASRWWLHHSLAALDSALQEHYGIPLLLRRGDSEGILLETCAATGADHVYCTRRYEPWAAELEQTVHEACQARDITVRRFPGNLLFEPGRVLTQNGDPYKVFTPFWRQCRALEEPALPLPLPAKARASAELPEGEKLADWQLCPQKPDWAAHWSDWWQPGAEGAADRLQAFLEDAIERYPDERDRPATAGTSRLSPHLHYGEISPRMIWHAARNAAREQPKLQDPVDKFLSELGWREFSYHLLSFFPDLPEQPFKEQFRDFPWRESDRDLTAWQRGQTGYPLVDAGMRELWHTGYMHNRVRMVTASFLTKHLLLHWRHGEQWFWDTLVDADLANNAASWQWVAGSGADAAPYFRIFNPLAQSEKFDPGGDYLRRWVPELADLPDKFLHRPFEAPEEVLGDAGVTLGEDYPRPIVEHKAAREAALAAYDRIRS
jgi:deoxyribodipyrimidine photo-lyase